MNYLNMGLIIGLAKILSIISGITFARILGPEEYGSYALLMSILLVVSIPSTAGMQNFITRNLSLHLTKKDNENAAKLIQWCIKHIVVLFLIISFLLMVTNTQGPIRFLNLETIFFFIFFVLARGLQVFSNGILITYNKAPLSYFICQIAPQVLMLLLFIILSQYYFVDHNTLFIITSLLFIAASLISLRFVFNEIKGIDLLANLNIRYSFKENGWGKKLVVFSGIGIISTFISEFATIMLGIFHDEESVAYFRIAYQGSALILLPLAAIDLLIAPKISSYFTKNDYLSIQRVLKKSSIQLIIFSLPIFVFLYSFSSEIITVFFGEEYLASDTSLKVLSLGFFVSLFLGPVSISANMMNLEKNLLVLMILNLILTILLMVFLIPPYKVEGAAYSVAISSIGWSVLLSIIIKRKRHVMTWLH